MDGVDRRLAAILAADVVGYSRLMGRDERGTLLRVKSHLAELFRPKVMQYRGRIVKTTGDGVLAEFGSVVDAFQAAVEIQDGTAVRNIGKDPSDHIELRIGINFDEIIFDEDDVFGDGVNVAARLEGIAEPGGVCVSARGWEELRHLDFDFEDLGERELKNLQHPVHVYRLIRSDLQRPATPTKAAPRRRLGIAWVAAALAVGGVLATGFTSYRSSSAGKNPEAFVSASLDQMPCSWLRIAEHRKVEGANIFRLAGASLTPPNAISSSIQRASTTKEVDVDRIETDGVAPLFEKQCPWIDKIRPLRYTGAPRVSYETRTDTKAITAIDVFVDLRDLGKVVNLYGIDPNGSVTPLGDSTELLALAEAGDGIERLPDGRLKLTIAMDHSGWSGLVFAESDQPMPKGLIERASQSPVELAEFDKLAQQGNWRFELIWFRSELRGTAEEVAREYKLFNEAPPKS